MAGLLDFLDMPIWTTPGINPEAPMYDMMGIDPNQVRRDQMSRQLMALGTGIASGNNWTQGLTRGLQNFADVRGSAENDAFRRGILGLQYQQLKKSMEPPASYRTLTSQEAADMGLPSDRVWQQSPAGQISAAFTPKEQEGNWRTLTPYEAMQAGLPRDRGWQQSPSGEIKAIYTPESQPSPIFQRWKAPGGIEIPRVSYDNGRTWQDMTTGAPSSDGSMPWFDAVRSNENAAGDPFAVAYNPPERGGPAMGMAQLQQRTFDTMADQAGVPDRPSRDIFNPSQNLAMGERYYDQQLASFNDPVLAAGAYHAGPGNMKAYMVQAGYQPGMGYDQLISKMEGFAPKTAKYMADFIGKAAPQQTTDYSQYADTSGVFGGTGFQTSAMNIIASYQDKKGRGEATTPEEDRHYALAVNSTVQISTDPYTGARTAYSPITGYGVNIDANGQPIGQPFYLGAGGAPGMGPQPTGELPQQPPQQMGLSGRDIPGRGGTPEGSTIVRAAGEGTGAVSALAQWYQNTVGQVPGMPQADETVAASNALRLFNQTVKEALVNNDRFPMAEQNLVQAMLPDAGAFFANPSDAQNKVRQLYEYIKKKQEQNRNSLGQRYISGDERKRLMDQNASLETALNMIESMPIIGQTEGPSSISQPTDNGTTLFYDEGGNRVR